MSHRRGDVVLVRIDFTDQSGAKLRPAVVVSDERYNQGPDRLIASITSNLQPVPHWGDHRLRDWQQAGLKVPSLAQVKIATVEASIIVRTLGRLSEFDLRALEQGLARALGLEGFRASRV
jgi:mRNA interferase MazF